MRRPAAILSLAMVLATAPNARAFNPERLDILRLQLGMTEAQVTAVLSRQGVAPDRIRRSPAPCDDARPCGATIVAPTPDGELTIVLTGAAAGGGPTVHQITYVITGHALNQNQALKDTVLERFGQPDQAVPMTWCRTPAIDQTCPASQAWLRFWPDAQTIVLKAAESDSDGSARQP